MPKAKLMSSVEITEEPDGGQFKELYKNCKLASTRTAEPSKRVLRRAGLTEGRLSTLSR
jgi:hypothetical protein